MRRAWLRVQRSNDPAELAALAETVGTPRWVMVESYPELRFERWTPGEAIPPLGEELAGRVFGAVAEVRWVREGDRFDAWLLEEVAGQMTDAAFCECTERSYYGLGYWGDGRFWQTSLPGDRVSYPLEGSATDDRPRFRVVEYRRLAPDPWPRSLDAIEEQLNLPSLAAYRLVGFDAGKGKA